MAKVVVIYKSKYGATKKYAEWLAEDIGAELFSKDEFKIEMLANYDTIIYGGGIYGSRVSGLSLIKKNYNNLKNKNIIVFMVGASPYDEKAYIQLKEHNFSDELKNIKLFYLRGMFDLKSMSFRDKFLIGMLKGVLSKKDPLQFEPWEKAFVESMDKAADWTSRENLKEIEDYINEY